MISVFQFLQCTLKFCLPLVFLGTMAQGPLAHAGGAISSGGDAYAAQFVRLGEEVLQMLKRKPYPGVKARAFEKALQSTRVNSKDRVLLNGSEVDAINTPSRSQIIMSRSRWNQSVNDPRGRIVLVAHEYFGIMGLDDRNYVLSKGLFASPGVALSRYDCLLMDVPGLAKLRLIATIYREFADLSFLDAQGKPWDSEIKAFYTYIIKDPNPTDGEFQSTLLVSMDMGLWAQMVSLPYASDSPRGKTTRVKAKSINIAEISPMNSRRQDLACDLTQF